jgi:CheY-like chemotaxis protein
VTPAQKSSPPAGAPDPVPEAFGVVALLAGVPVVAEDLAALEDVRLTAAVAAALRAVLDWLTGEVVPSRPLRARADDAALEIVLERVDGRGLRAAGDVLASVGGSLGRVESARPDAPWAVRVPVHAAREQYVMVIEEGVPLAFAWPAVIHIVMARADELSAGLSAPRVPSLVQGPGPDAGVTSNAEFPVILIGHGLKRGYYVAERLVWRLPGVPIETVEPPPVAGLTHAVQSDEGDCYWVADPGWLLRGVGEPALDVPALPTWLPQEPIQVLGDADIRPFELLPADVDPLEHAEPPARPVSVPDPEPVIGSTPPPAPAVILPAPAVVQPPATPPAPAVVQQPATPPAPAVVQPPATPPAPAVVQPPATPPAPAIVQPPVAPVAPAPAPPALPAPGSRAALVAEDSITASIFLARLLEQQGFLVRTVGTAAELAGELARGDWALVCVDVELPDGRGREHLRAVREAHERVHATGPGPAALIALVRDPEDVAEAQAAGITRVLRKPFDREALEQLLRRIGPRAGGGA